MTDLLVRWGGCGILRNRGDLSNVGDDFEMGVDTPFQTIYTFDTYQNVELHKSVLSLFRCFIKIGERPRS